MYNSLATVELATGRLSWNEIPCHNLLCLIKKKKITLIIKYHIAIQF